MSIIDIFLKFFCCRRKKLKHDVWDSISYKDWENDYDGSLNYLSFYSSIPRGKTSPIYTL